MFHLVSMDISPHIVSDVDMAGNPHKGNNILVLTDKNDKQLVHTLNLRISQFWKAWLRMIFRSSQKAVQLCHADNVNTWKAISMTVCGSHCPSHGNTIRKSRTARVCILIERMQSPKLYRKGVYSFSIPSLQLNYLQLSTTVFRWAYCRWISK